MDTESVDVLFFFESSCEQEYLIPVADDGFVDVIEEDVQHFYSRD